MKILFAPLTFIAFSMLPVFATAQTNSGKVSGENVNGKNLFLDVHQLTPGKVKYEDVAAAHIKDLAAEKKHGVHFIKYWVNEEKGLVYCLASANDSAAVTETHAEAHGLLPDRVYKVSDGTAAALTKSQNFFLDVHYLGAGNVTAKDVAGAHLKDLATQKKYGVNFVNYWVDEKQGMVMCLSQAKDSTSVINTHKEAHGLLPAYIVKVKPGE